MDKEILPDERFGKAHRQVSPSPDEKNAHSDNEEFLCTWSLRDQNSLMRRVDVRLIPICGIMYCVSLLDRTNLSNAAIAGMAEELTLGKVNGVDRYPPATVLCRKFGPRAFLSSITFLWGIVMLSMGFIQEWTTLLTLRLVLGIFEAGFFPGVVYLLSTWYTRYGVGKRYAFFYLIGCVASDFGGILAFGLMQMEGLANYGGWRWIFVIEGLLTVVIAAMGFLLLRSFPDDFKSRTLKFLTQEERQCIIARVNHDRGDATVEKFSLKRWAASGLDWKIWAYATIFGATTTVSYALAYFLPQILNYSLGFDTGTAQCLVAPPYAFAGIMMMVTGWWGDKYHMRGPAVAFDATLAIIGLALVGFYDGPEVRYLGVFLATAGANANVPVCMSYQANNIRGQWKRAFCSASLVGFGAVGGIIGSTVFRSEDAPSYVPGVSVAIGAQLLVMLCVALLSLEFKRQNEKADRGRKILEEGDANFRYTY